MMNVVPFAKERPAKPFQWSYSRLKNYETCPKRYYEVDLHKNFKDTNPKLEYGEEVHKAFADRLSRRKSLPVTLRRYEPEMERIERLKGKLRTELELAFDNQFRASGWFDNATWFRAKVDVLVHEGESARLSDWKTGKVFEDYAQLATQAQAVFANYPEVEEVAAEFVWVGEPVTYTKRGFTRRSLMQEWNGLWPRMQSLVQAHETQVFPPKEGPFCARSCPVETCKFNGRNR